MPSWQAVVASFLLRHTWKPLLRNARGVGPVRALLGAGALIPAFGARVRCEAMAGIPGEWVERPGSVGPVLLYLHGGGYVACSPRSHRAVTVALARRGLRVFAPHYRRAPEAPFPAALEDALAVYRALRAQGPVLLGGDSAGGGLALALLLSLRDAGDPLPAAVALFSPLTDLVSDGGSRATERCALLAPGCLGVVRDWYLRGHDARDPLVSPVFGDLGGLPPMLVHVSRDELLFDDAVHLAERARAAGVDVSITAWPGVPHVWQTFPHLIPEARESLDAASRFFLRHARAAVDVDVLIVGTGFSGLCMARRLQQAGQTSFLLLEKADDVGGTWRENTYPGCACDIPSHLYSLSFEPRSDWTRMYPTQPEIWRYMRDIVAQRDLRRHIRFNAEMREAVWDEGAHAWRATTTDGATITARVLVSGIGGLSRPAIPDLPGLDRFRGRVFHSAQWDHEYDLTEKRVAVIGTGASAVQFVPQIAPRVARLSLFQRTPPWILPRRDRPITDRERWLMRHVPGFRWGIRQRIYWFQELLALGFTVWPRLMRPLERLARRYIAASIADPTLRDKVTPRYAMGCKRVLTSNDYYPALARSNVEVVTQPIREIDADGVVTRDGRTHRVDALIFGTGFRATDALAPLRIVGRDGIDLDRAWRDGMQAHCGVTVHGFPNLFLLVGPNTGLGHNSIVFMIEAQVHYVMACLARMRSRGAVAMEVRAEAQAAYNAALQKRLARTVWATGCRSWYLDAHGRNTTLWPSFTFSYWARTLRPAARDYDFE